MVLSTINIVLITEDADGHSRAGNLWQFDRARETLVSLRIIVLEADLEFDGLKEVALLGFVRVLEDFFYAACMLVPTHDGRDRRLNECGFVGVSVIQAALN